MTRLDIHQQFTRPDFPVYTDDLLAGHPSRPQPVAFRTLLDTSHRYDAGVCGMDCAAQPGEPDYLAVHYDGRGSIPSLIVNGGGEVSIDGLAAMQAFADAVLDAVRMARRQAGIA